MCGFRRSGLLPDPRRANIPWIAATKLVMTRTRKRAGQYRSSSACQRAARGTNDVRGAFRVCIEPDNSRRQGAKSAPERPAPILPRTEPPRSRQISRGFHAYSPLHAPPLAHF
ncbi:hypothetical protein AWB81_03103 [Caballeronia arationis]|jgi:hypothetical protein|uniref:Uncharacterized protein n=1 Tax=Caballeronia arationis TaxID=1777142 RepID=A0A7Z7IAB4_9BURK|nr:hypothetical protein AWB81_03103 [Caballeronia arationis]SOE82185.1 hypothetical protein SAMN05446927_5498 [Caballeronia arationis]